VTAKRTAGKSRTVHGLPWGIKLAVFAASVVSLSWFFAGWRQIHEASTLASWSLLVGGTLATLLLLGVQGYWIYFEEKDKGTLRKRVEIFERIGTLLEGRSKHCAAGPQKGEHQGND